MGEIWHVPKLHVESIWASNKEKETKLVDRQTEQATKSTSEESLSTQGSNAKYFAWVDWPLYIATTTYYYYHPWN
jgi:hypothetical protein